MIDYDPPILRGRTPLPKVLPVSIDYPLRYRELFGVWEELKKRLQDRFKELKQQQGLLMEDRETKDIPNLLLRTENRGMRRMLMEIMQTMSDMEDE